ncbi:MAG: VanZ family protein [Dehalococcoidia bacterium]
MARHHRIVAVAVWAALIFTVSSFPNPPGTSGGEWKSQLAHTTEYAILAFLVLRALRHYFPAQPWPMVALATWVLCVCYGMSDEFHQSFVPNRDANWLDVGFDSLGSAIGVTIGVTIGVALACTRRRLKTWD